MIFDISQEVFHCAVFPGDPSPVREKKLEISQGAVCNLTAFSMCAHNGTHIDAPNHFLSEGKTVDQISLEAFIGYAYVASYEGEVSKQDAKGILEKAEKADFRSMKRILIKGAAIVTEEAAEVFAEAGILLLGNESQTVGPEKSPMKTHLILLKKEVVLLEGIRLAKVEEGTYFLNCAPINLGGCDGSPCRAVLIRDE